MEITKYINLFATWQESGGKEEHEILLATNKDLAAKVHSYINLDGNSRSVSLEYKFEALVQKFEKQIRKDEENTQ